MIAALYVRKNGHYYGLPDVDPWDEAREAEHVVQLTRLVEMVEVVNATTE